MAELDQISLSTRRRLGSGTLSRSGRSPGEPAPRQTSPKQLSLGRRLPGSGGKKPIFRAGKGSSPGRGKM